MVTYRSAFGRGSWAEITLPGLAVVFRGCGGFVFSSFRFWRWFRFVRGGFVFFMVAKALIFLPSGPCIIKSNPENARLFQFCPRTGINSNEIIALDFVLILSENSSYNRNKFIPILGQKWDNGDETSLWGESAFSLWSESAFHFGAYAHLHFLFGNAFSACVRFCSYYMEKLE